MKQVLLIFIFLTLIASCATKNFKSSTQELSLSSADKKLIDSMIEGKRVVLVGEPDHWIKEKGAYQIAMIDYLVKKGFSTILNERSYLDSQNIQEYINSGNEEVLSKIGENGYKNPNWPKRNPKGFLIAKDHIQSEYRARLKSNDYYFYSKLREIFLKNQINYAGYDVDKIPDIVFDRLEEFIPIFSSFPNKDCKKIANLLKRSPRGIITKELRALSEANDRLRNCPIKQLMTTDKQVEFKSTLMQAHESIQFLAVALNSPSLEALMPAYEKRKLTMLRNIENIIGDKKVIVLGHNAHLSRNENEYRRMVISSGKIIEVPNWKSLGSMLNDSYGNKALFIWMLTEKGSHSASFCEDTIPCAFQSPKDTIEFFLGKKFEKRLEACAVLKQELSTNRLVWMENGINQITGDICKATDMVYFIKISNGI